MKFYTQDELNKVASDYSVPVAKLKQLIDIQSKGVGTLGSNHAKIVFHRDIFKKVLTDNGLTDAANVLTAHWNMPTEVNLEVAETLWNKPTVNEVKQEQHFDNVLNIIFANRPELTKANKEKITECAYKACTIGLGQVLGNEFTNCGYNNFHTFIGDMFTSEYLQLKALGEYLKSKGLTGQSAENMSVEINKAVGNSPLIAGSKDTDVGVITDKLRSKL